MKKATATRDHDKEIAKRWSVELGGGVMAREGRQRAQLREVAQATPVGGNKPLKQRSAFEKARLLLGKLLRRQERVLGNLW